MAVSAPLTLALADALRCLGLGFLLAAAYDLAAFFLGSSRPARFVLDLAGALAAAVLCTGFAAAASAAGRVRWYMAAGLALGLFCYFHVLAPAFGAAGRVVKWALSRPFALARLGLARPAAGLARRLWAAAGRKIRLAAQKYRKKQLKNTARVLYNSDIPYTPPGEQYAHFSRKKGRP